MPIKVPGHRDRHGRKGGGKRSAVAVLQVTAMVDMFTVLAVFLLQNYASTGHVIHLAEDVELPAAGTVRELQPSNVVIISPNEIKFNNELVAEFSVVKEQEDWNVEGLDEMIKKSIEEGEQEKKSLTNQIKDAINKKSEVAEDEIDSYRKMTIQADKEVDFLTIKKVMYTITNAGIYEINFAVLKVETAEEKAAREAKINN